MRAIIIDGEQIRVSSYSEEEERDTGYTIGKFTAAPRKHLIELLKDGKYHDVTYYVNDAPEFHHTTYYPGVKLEVVEIDTHKNDLEDYPRMLIGFKSNDVQKEILTAPPAYSSERSSKEWPLRYMDCLEFIDSYK